MLKHVKTKILTVTLLAFLVFSVVAVLLPQFKFEIATGGVTDHPSGKLHIGNETEGENPCFFYDENGRLVLLRSLQNFVGEPYFTQSLTGDGWWNGHSASWCDIQNMINTSRNMIRCHFYMAWLFPQKETANDTFFDTYLIPWLQDLKDEGFYFQFEMWNDNGTSGVPIPYPSDNGTSWWWNKEAQDYSLLWNTTVQDDLIWMWNYTIGKLYDNNLLDHLVLIEPICEYPYPASMVMEASANPFYHSELMWDYAVTNASQDSWHAWLENRHTNIANLKTAWGIGLDEEWNATGTETDEFSSLLFSNRTEIGYGNVRAFEMRQWTHESMVNWTKHIYNDINAQWTGNNKIYIGWDADDSGGGIFRIQNQSDTRYYARYTYSLLDFAEYSDAIFRHYYPTPLTGAGGDIGKRDRLGDYSLALTSKLSAWARAVKKPFILDESGCSSGSWFSGYNGWTTWATQNYKVAWTNATVRMALTDGFAGLNNFYCQYSHSIWGTPDPAGNVSYWEPYMKVQMERYKAAENWLDKQYYAPITVVYDYGTSMMSEGDATGWMDFALFKSVGITPKYACVTTDNGTLYPNIPEDTEIIVWSLTGRSSYLPTAAFMNTLNQSLCENNTKLILGGESNGNWFTWYNPPQFQLESCFNTSKFPMTDMVRGTDYFSESNSTNYHISLYGETIEVRRSVGWDARMYWNVTSIDAKWSINTTDGMNRAGWGKEPFMIQSDQVAWLPLGFSKSNTWLVGGSEYNLFDPNSGLVFRKILENWGYFQPFVSQNYPDDAYGHALTERAICNYTSNFGIATIGSHNLTAYSYPVKINLTALGMDDINYVIFNPNNQTTYQKTRTEMETGFNWQVEGNQSGIIVFRANSTPCFLYGTGYKTSESFSSGNLSLKIAGTPNRNGTTYVWWNSSTQPDVSTNATVYNISWNSTNQLLTLTANHTSIIEWEIGAGNPNLWQFTFNHLDLDTNVVDAKITWKLYNTSQLLTYTEGEYTLLDGTYTLKTYYQLNQINQTSLPTATYGNTTINILLQMKTMSTGYIAFNNTISGITINSQTRTNLTFTATGAEAYQITIGVDYNATSITKDGVPKTYGTDWLYDSGNNVIIVNSTLSVWTLTFPGDGGSRVLFETGGSLGFQNDIDKTVILEIIGGTLNSTQNIVILHSGGGEFHFTALNATEIKITYTVSNVQVSGDQNNRNRQIQSGSTITVETGNNIVISWNILIEPWLPLLFIIGMFGLGAMFGGPLYAVNKIKKGEYHDAMRVGLLVTVTGIAFVLAWLW